MHDFQDTGFVPFDAYVQRARQQRIEREKNAEHQRRVTDFLDGVSVIELTEMPPEFADTVPADDVEAAVAAKLRRAMDAVQARHRSVAAKLAGHFPPGSHEA